MFTRRGFLTTLLLAPFAALVRLPEPESAPRVINVRRGLLVGAEANRLYSSQNADPDTWFALAS